MPRPVAHLANLDLNLLVALRELVRERSVTRAAERLGVTQPAASAALSRLRRHFGDELLIRDRGEYTLTALGAQLAEQVDAVCAHRLRRSQSPQGRSPVVPAPVRIGLAGYGLGGRYFHAPLIASAANCEFLGVVTTSPERRGQVAEDLGLPAFDDLAELASAGAEAVAISTPAATHVPLTQQALRLGLAVVCDKPFALDADSARVTVELAEQLDVPLTVYQNRRWDSDFLTLRDLLDKGELGTLTVFESRFERFRPQPGPRAAGGGTLLDFGSHLADQALVLAGPVSRVYAEVHYRTGPGKLDDDVFIALTHESGVQSHLWGSWWQGAPGPRFRAAGTKGTYVIQDVDGQEAQLRSGGSPATSGDQWGVEPPERWGYLLRGDAKEPVPSARGAWTLFYPAFAAAVRGERPVPVNPWDAVATAAVLDAARASARTAQVVTPAE